MRRRGLFFGDRPLCTVLRPRLITPDRYAFLQARCRTLLRAFARVYRAAVEDAAFRSQLGLLEWEEELARHDPGFRDPSPTSRLDIFFGEQGGLHLTEYNGETPAGAAYSDALSDAFLALPLMREYLRHYEVRPLPGRHGVLHTLLDAHRQWGGRREPPRIAILDWRELPTFSEFVLYDEYFRSLGLESVIADPREVEYRDGRLLAGGFHITLIYKRALISELIAHGGLDDPVVRAVRDGAVCMVNPFRCKLLHKKASLAVVSDERNAFLLDAEERTVVDAHVPWTRVVEERWTTYHGREIDLIPFILDHRDGLVLKPNDDYGGRGIVLGWEVDATAWSRALTTALREPYIVQERITLPSEPFPSWVDGRVLLMDRMLDTAPFVSYGDYPEGCMTRLSTVALLNVTAGGGSTVPTFVVQRR